ncbi:DUF4880 domain-containing protein [Novosphingobium profundi]|uniref:FecR family protein n=1 Tax=Novosphingobium profundi TaxID=1774954 RepID=UPI001BD95FD7|nr:DUF4880 domain-containing protein [Novosphingobium profundi]MBT0670620.1 DUF4880 domain-containing protein [Novosphingobium profundi]
MNDRAHIPAAIHAAAARWVARAGKGEADYDAKLAAWLARDPRHRQAYEEVHGVWDVPGEIGHTAIGRDRRLVRAPVYMRRSTHLALGAAGLVGCLGLTLAVVGIPGRDLGVVSVAHAASYSTRIGEIRRFKTKGGLVLVLDSNSRVAVSQEGGDVELDLARGRIRVETAEGHVRVRAGARSLRVDGSPFDVSFEAGMGHVLAPRVPIRVAAGDRVVELAMGQRSDLDAKVLAPGADDANWVSGMLAVENMPLGEAVAIINRYARRPLLLADPALASRPVTGAFRRSDPEAFARTVARIYDLEIDQSRTDRVVLRTR